MLTPFKKQRKQITKTFSYEKALFQSNTEAFLKCFHAGCCIQKSIFS